MYFSIFRPLLFLMLFMFQVVLPMESGNPWELTVSQCCIPSSAAGGSLVPLGGNCYFAVTPVFSPDAACGPRGAFGGRVVVEADGKVVIEEYAFPSDCNTLRGLGSFWSGLYARFSPIGWKALLAHQKKATKDAKDSKDSEAFTVSDALNIRAFMQFPAYRQAVREMPGYFAAVSDLLAQPHSVRHCLKKVDGWGEWGLQSYLNGEREFFKSAMAAYTSKVVQVTDMHIHELPPEKLTALEKQVNELRGDSLGDDGQKTSLARVLKNIQDETQQRALIAKSREALTAAQGEVRALFGGDAQPSVGYVQRLAVVEEGLRGSSHDELLRPDERKLATQLAAQLAKKRLEVEKRCAEVTRRARLLEDSYAYIRSHPGVTTLSLEELQGIISGVGQFAYVRAQKFEGEDAKKQREISDYIDSARKQVEVKRKESTVLIYVPSFWIDPNGRKVPGPGQWVRVPEDSPEAKKYQEDHPPRAAQAQTIVSPEDEDHVPIVTVTPRDGSMVQELTFEQKLEKITAQSQECVTRYGEGQPLMVLDHTIVANLNDLALQHARVGRHDQAVAIGELADLMSKSCLSYAKTIKAGCIVAQEGVRWANRTKGLVLDPVGSAAETANAVGPSIGKMVRMFFCDQEGLADKFKARLDGLAESAQHMSREELFRATVATGYDILGFWLAFEVAGPAGATGDVSVETGGLATAISRVKTAVLAQADMAATMSPSQVAEFLPIVKACEDVSGVMGVVAKEGKALATKAFDIVGENPQLVVAEGSFVGALEKVAVVEREVERGGFVRQCIEESKPGPGAKVVDFQRYKDLDDGSGVRVIFRRDVGVGEHAHAIDLHGYPDAVNHYNVEVWIPKKGISVGEWVEKGLPLDKLPRVKHYNYHIILDEHLNVVEGFGKKLASAGSSEISACSCLPADGLAKFIGVPVAVVAKLMQTDDTDLMEGDGQPAAKKPRLLDRFKKKAVAVSSAITGVGSSILHGVGEVGSMIIHGVGVVAKKIGPPLARSTVEVAIETSVKRVFAGPRVAYYRSPCDDWRSPTADWRSPCDAWHSPCDDFHSPCDGRPMSLHRRDTDFQHSSEAAPSMHVEYPFNSGQSAGSSSMPVVEFHTEESSFVGSDSAHPVVAVGDVAMSDDPATVTVAASVGMDSKILLDALGQPGPLAVIFDRMVANMQRIVETYGSTRPSMVYNQAIITNLNELSLYYERLDQTERARAIADVSIAVYQANTMTAQAAELLKAADSGVVTNSKQLVANMTDNVVKTSVALGSAMLMFCGGDHEVPADKYEALLGAMAARMSTMAGEEPFTVSFNLISGFIAISGGDLKLVENIKTAVSMQIEVLKGFGPKTAARLAPMVKALQELPGVVCVAAKEGPALVTKALGIVGENPQLVVAEGSLTGAIEKILAIEHR